MLNKKALSAAFGVEKDANFKQTVLLLHGDGTNGAQNNTFTDSSTNNFTITRNGNTTQGTFSPFSVAAGEWSNYFDGSGDYLKFDNGTFYLSNNNFVIEAFVYLPNSISGSNGTIAAGNTDAATAAGSSWDMTINTSQKLASTVWIGSTNYTITSSASVSTGQWVHLAFVRTGGTISQFINGTKDGTNTTLSTNSVQNGSNTYPPHVGRNGGGADFPGYISNFRLIVGSNASSVYDATGSSITAPTAPLTAVTDTKVLTCRSNRFVDISSSPNTITIYGTPSVQPFSPFAPSAAYSASTNGGSGYFDGSGDYLSMSDNASFQIGSSAFSIELWYYILSSASERRFVSQWASAPNKGVVLTTENLTPRFYYTLDGTTDTSIQSSTTPAINQWNHLVVCRSGSTLSMFLNGSRVATATQSGTFANVTGDITIGSGVSGNEPMYGYISGLRSVIGSSQYDATQTTITVPTAPPTAVTNTQLLCNFTGAAIFDQTGKNNLETVGNAQIDTGTKKFGTGSMEFDGTGDYFKMAGPAENFAFGSGDFTIEFWYYSNNTGVQQVPYDSRSVDNGAYMAIYKSTGNVFAIYVNGDTRITGSTTISASTWYHIAVTRSGTSTKLFVNGTQDGSTYTDSNSYLNPVNRPIIGADGLNLGNTPVNGFIDDLRVTKGIARYTANFTPPAKAFADL